MDRVELKVKKINPDVHDYNGDLYQIMQNDIKVKFILVRSFGLNYYFLDANGKEINDRYIKQAQIDVLNNVLNVDNKELRKAIKQTIEELSK